MSRVLVLVACVGCRLHFDELDDAGPTCKTIPGLVAYFPMNAGDMAGSVLLDRSGNAHDGSMIGDPLVLAPGPRGDALDFTATALAYVEVAVPLSAAPGAAVTVSLWFFQPEAFVDEVLIDMPGPPLPRYDLWLVRDSLCINASGNDCWGITDHSRLFGRWLHVAAVFKNGPTIDSSYYLDGASVVLGCEPAPFNACDVVRTVMSPMRLGAADAYEYHGILDEVRLYDRELTADEVSALYADTVCP